ncbi:MAG: hypothetical protein HRU05_14610 [Oceanospirillaceae bacterium]|nr:hypothetical protein [Oceanospirillaceae bacterium]
MVLLLRRYFNQLLWALWLKKQLKDHSVFAKNIDTKQGVLSMATFSPYHYQ